MAAAIQTQSPAPQRVGNNPSSRSSPLLFLACCGFPNLLHIPIYSSLRSSPLPCLTHPPIHPSIRRRGGRCSWCSSYYCWCHYSFPRPISFRAYRYWVFFATEIQPRVDSPFFSPLPCSATRGGIIATVRHLVRADATKRWG